MLKDIIKKILPPSVQIIVKDILYIERTKRRIRPFLPPGIYRIHIMPISRRRLTVVPKLLIKIGQPYKGYVPETVQPGIKQLICYFAFKVVFITDNRVISLYLNTETARDRLQRIKKYIDDVAYPRSEYLEISVTNHYTVTERINGKSCFEKKRVLYLAKELLRFAAQAQEMPKPEKYGYLDSASYPNIKYYVQHGDVNCHNVLWQDEMHYMFIDFDEINVFPAFYDFFYIILSEEGRGLEEFLNGYFDREISNYMMMSGIKAPIEMYMDECMSAFLLVPGKYVFDADRIARQFVPKNYKKTWRVLAAKEKDGEVAKGIKE